MNEFLYFFQLYVTQQNYLGYDDAINDALQHCHFISSCESFNLILSPKEANDDLFMSIEWSEIVKSFGFIATDPPTYDNWYLHFKKNRNSLCHKQIIPISLDELQSYLNHIETLKLAIASLKYLIG